MGSSVCLPFRNGMAVSYAWKHRRRTQRERQLQHQPSLLQSKRAAHLPFWSSSCVLTTATADSAFSMNRDGKAMMAASWRPQHDCQLL